MVPQPPTYCSARHPSLKESDMAHYSLHITDAIGLLNRTPHILAFCGFSSSPAFISGEPSW